METGLQKAVYPWALVRNCEILPICSETNVKGMSSNNFALFFTVKQKQDRRQDRK